MKKILLSCLVILAAVGFAAEPMNLVFRDSFYHAVVSAPSDWSLDAGTISYNALFTPPTGNLKVTLVIYESSPSINTDKVYLQRAGQFYDGWNLLAMRQDTEKNAWLLGVDEHLSVIFEQKYLDDNFTEYDTIVAEEYMVHQGVVFVLSATAYNEADWLRWLESVKAIFKSFYVED